MSKTTAHVTLDLDDVRRAGSVRAAILEWAEGSDDTASGVIGPEFSTSGPGPGWSKAHDESDFARRALSPDYGALYYIDADDGRLAERADGMIDTDDEPGEVEWTSESVVRLECPSVEDAVEHPAVVAEMAQAVIDYHGAESDREDWRKLIVSIREAAEALEDIGVDALGD